MSPNDAPTLPPLHELPAVIVPSPYPPPPERERISGSSAARKRPRWRRKPPYMAPKTILTYDSRELSRHLAIASLITRMRLADLYRAYIVVTDIVGILSHAGLTPLQRVTTGTSAVGGWTMNGRGRMSRHIKTMHPRENPSWPALHPIDCLATCIIIDCDAGVVNTQLMNERIAPVLRVPGSVLYMVESKEMGLKRLADLQLEAEILDTLIREPDLPLKKVRELPDFAPTLVLEIPPPPPPRTQDGGRGGVPWSASGAVRWAG